MRMTELLSCFALAVRKRNSEISPKLNPTGKNIKEAYHEKAEEI